VANLQIGPSRLRERPRNSAVADVGTSDLQARTGGSGEAAGRASTGRGDRRARLNKSTMRLTSALVKVEGILNYHPPGMSVYGL
jgi:hypothetical protein